MIAHHKSSRRGDSATFSRHDPGRFFKTRDRWYFKTREGTTEGPFAHPEEAEDNLDFYIRMVSEEFYLGE